MRYIRLTLCVLFAVLITFRESPAAIPIPETATTEHDYRRGLLLYNRRTIVEPYETAGRRDPKWDDSALAFLNAVALRFSDANVAHLYSLPAVPSLEQTMALGKKAIDAGCNDPMVAYCYGALLEDNGWTDEAEPFLRFAGRALFDSQYPVIRAATAAERLFVRDASRSPRRAQRHWEQFRDATLATVVSWDFVEIDRRVLFNMIWVSLPDFSPDQQKEFADALTALDDADPWLKHTLLGHLHVQLAWASRGSGWAHTVTDEGWGGFHEHLALAKQHLESAWEIRQDYPEPACEMITVAMGAGPRLGADARAWFERAISAQMDHLQSYRTYLWSIYPRWGGSHRQMHEFAVECLRSERFDTMIPFFYVKTVYDIARDGMPQIFDRRDLSTNVLRCLEGYEAQQRDSLGDLELSLIAALAWRAKDYQTVTRIEAEVRHGLWWTGFDLMGIGGDMAMSHAHAMNSNHAERVAEAEMLVSQQKYDEAIAIYTELAPRFRDHRGEFYVHTRRAELIWMKPFLAGQWTDIQPPADWTGWLSVAPTKMQIDPDGSLVVTVQQDWETSFILCRGTLFGNRYEFAGEVDFGDVHEISAGPIFAYVDDEDCHRLYLRRDRQMLEVRSDAGIAHSVPAEIRNLNTFRVLVWDDHIVAYCNEKKVLDGYEVEDRLTDRRRRVGVGLGRARQGTEVKFRNLRIRLLTEPPEGLHPQREHHVPAPMRPRPNPGLL